MQRLARARKIVVFALKDHHAAVHAALLQRRIQLEALRNRAAIIAIRMDNQRGRNEILCIFQRRLLPHLFWIVKHRRVRLVFAEQNTDVARAIKAHPVRNTALRCRAAEAVGMVALAYLCIQYTIPTHYHR